MTTPAATGSASDTFKREIKKAHFHVDENEPFLYNYLRIDFFEFDGS